MNLALERTKDLVDAGREVLTPGSRRGTAAGAGPRRRRRRGAAARPGSRLPRAPRLDQVRRKPPDVVDQALADVDDAHLENSVRENEFSAIKAKFSHTRYRALGPELIPVYRQSARR